jgi:DNA-binding SARP family transcriptional activator
MQALVRVLGPVEVHGSAGPVQLSGPKERCLLAVLAAHLGNVVSEDELVEALWDGTPPRTSSKTLQNYVLRLRRRLGAATILTWAPGYTLTGVRTDADTARALVARGRRDAERRAYAAAVDAFDEALGLWRGRAYAEFAERSFARDAAAGLEELRAAVSEERLAAILAAGDHRDVVAECEKMVAEEPLRERRWSQLMLALYREGRQGEALGAYRRLPGDPGRRAGRRPESRGPRARGSDPRARSAPAAGTSTVGTGRGRGGDLVRRSRARAADAPRVPGGCRGGPWSGGVPDRRTRDREDPAPDRVRGAGR